MAARAVGFIGLGIMGARMAACLAKDGFDVTVHNRTASRADEWVSEHGGRAVATPREAAEGADAVITMVVDGSQVEELLLGEQGAAAGAAAGTLFVDMSTIGPEAARRIGEELAGRGHRFVDAPVTGSSPAAEAGTLTIMAGGADADVADAMPLFESMGETIVRAGDLGRGQAIKVLSNSVTAINCATLAQAFVVGRRQELDLDALIQVMAGGSAASKMLDLKARPMLEHDYSPLFKLDHMLKDVRLALEESRLAGGAFPLAADVAELYSAASGRGLGQEDIAAVLETVEGLADTRL